jgi:hypothetical protein
MAPLRLLGIAARAAPNCQFWLRLCWQRRPVLLSRASGIRWRRRRSRAGRLLHSGRDLAIPCAGDYDCANDSHRPGSGHQTPRWVPRISWRPGHVKPAGAALCEDPWHLGTPRVCGRTHVLCGRRLIPTWRARSRASSLAVWPSLTGMRHRGPPASGRPGAAGAEVP